MVRSEADRLRRVIVCSPRIEYFLRSDFSEHNFDGAPDPETARLQHAALTAVLRHLEADVIDAMELPGHPNSVFTRDTLLASPAGYIELNMGLKTRVGEPAWLAQVCDRIGARRAGQIVPPATVEGGDVILAGDVAFIGLSRRTNSDGVRQLRELLEPLGFECRVAPVPDIYLHIGGAMSLVDDRLVLTVRGALPASLFRGFETILIDPAAFATGNVITVGNHIIIALPVPRTVRHLLESHGLTVIELDLSEFVKGHGGPSCLIMPLDREPVAF